MHAHTLLNSTIALHQSPCAREKEGSRRAERERGGRSPPSFLFLFLPLNCMRNTVRRLPISTSHRLSTSCAAPGLIARTSLSSFLRPPRSTRLRPRSMASAADDGTALVPDAFVGRSTAPFDLGSLGAGWRVEAASASAEAFAVFRQGLEQSLNDKQRSYRYALPDPERSKRLTKHSQPHHARKRPHCSPHLGSDDRQGCCELVGRDRSSQ